MIRESERNVKIIIGAQVMINEIFDCLSFDELPLTYVDKIKEKLCRIIYLLQECGSLAKNENLE